MPDPRPFLTAEWRFLLMLNYEMDPAILTPYLPAGTELDLWEGKAIASVVGMMFLKTRVLGVPLPLHGRFEEVNLRFYVRAGSGDDARRGVVFIKEIVPKPWIARLARLLYGENYARMRMGHTIEEKKGAPCPQGLVEYSWRHRGRLNRLGGLPGGDPQPPLPGSEEEFITGQSWGFTRRGRGTSVYRVTHPAWRIWQVAQPYLLCNVRALYGAAFEAPLRRLPRSAYLADGSPVALYPWKWMKA